MKMFLTLMAGDTLVDANTIFASSSPSLIDAVIGRLDLMVDDAARDAREESDEDEVQGLPATARSDAAAEVQA